MNYLAQARKVLSEYRGGTQHDVAAPERDAVAPAKPEAIVDTPANTLQPHGDPDVLPIESWDEFEEPGDPCPRCGSLAAWWPIEGDARCLACDPPRRSLAVLERVERIRRRWGVASPEGTDQHLAGLRRCCNTHCSPTNRADTLAAGDKT